jgi:PemK-like, MazF-like toxin of type II toxin-antitoxin system
MSKVRDFVGRLLPARQPSVRVKAGSFTVAYSPALDGDPDPGEVVWTWVPYEDDPTQGKDRPVIVIGLEEGQLAVVPLTSKGGDRDELPIGSGGWDREHRPSYAKVDQVILVMPAAVRREGAILDRKVFDKVVVEVQRVRTR